MKAFKILSLSTLLAVGAGPALADKSAGEMVDDSLIQGEVKAKIMAEDFGDGVAINVDTYNGVVLLTGFADTKESKQRAGDLAAADKNVDDVINGIYVMD